MRIGFIGGISNLTEIPNRRHSDLQNLNADDHKQYSHLIGLDSEKPTTGILPGTLYFATDTQKLYRYDGTNWVYVKTMASFLDLLDTPNSYDGQAKKILVVNLEENAMEFSNIPSHIHSKNYVISNDIYFANDDSVTITGNTYQKAKEVTVDLDFPYNTVLRIYFEICSISGFQTVYGRIYRNDTPYGTERSANLYAWSCAGFTEDLAFNPGDKIQIYARTSHPLGQVVVKNFRILGKTVPDKFTFS